MKRLTDTAALTVAYFAVYAGAVWLGWAFYYAPPSEVASTFWPATGIALAALLLSPPRRWPLILLLTMVAHTGVGLVVSTRAPTLGIAAAGEALVGAALLRRLIGPRIRPSKQRDLFALLGLGAVVSPAVGATLGASLFSLQLPDASFGQIWRVWWMSDALGVLFTTPLVLGIAEEKPWFRPPVTRLPETALLLLGHALVVNGIFGRDPTAAPSVLDHTYASIPVLLWAVLRFGTRTVGSVLLILALFAVAYTARGSGPFAAPGLSEFQRALNLQFFLVMTALPALVFSAAVASWRRAERATSVSEEKFHKAFQASPDPIAISTLERGKLLEVNEAFVKLLGYSREELFDGSTVELGIWRSPDLRARIMEELREHGRVRNAEMEFVRKSGEVGCALFSAELMELNGETVMVTAAKDITDRRRTERKLEESRSWLQSLAAEMAVLEERERRRLAAALHDHVVQNLALAKIRLSKATRSGPGAAGETMNEVVVLLDEAIADTRNLVFEISPPVLHDLGFEPALTWLAERIAERHGLDVRVSAEAEPDGLREPVKIVLFQAVREVLINAVKHAGATRVDVSLTRRNGAVRVEISDDGHGFDAKALASGPGTGGGFGLFSIGERLEALGGSLEVDSVPGRGTRVALGAPLPAGEGAPLG